MSIPATVQRSIRVLSIYIILGAIITIWMATSAYLYIQLHAAEEITVLQAGTIRVQESEITNLVERVKELKSEKEIAHHEKAISRGAERKAIVTAYTWTGEKTASGTWPVEGRTVAGPSWVPFGTKVWIDGVGERTVEDRTHIRFDGRYDLYMGSKAECEEWGIQERIVK